MISDAAYWIALAHLPGWGYLKINRVIVRFHHERKLSPEAFFNLTAEEWIKDYGLNRKEIEDIKNARSEIANHAFLAEQLNNKGCHLIPLISEKYSATLKHNLKTSLSPPLLYVTGDVQLFQQKALAVVGSRNASELALKFTDKVVERAVSEGKVIISGFAKGIDKQALDSAIRYDGKSIIVLPQGIMTFESGFRKYYQQITNGKILVLSVFSPGLTWNVGLAMARNPIIYGLADEIVVAESGESGGTWHGVLDGLKRGRRILVRNPEPCEKSANTELINKGAIPVDAEGRVIEDKVYQGPPSLFTCVDEPSPE